jgi:uncharacterized protein (DUF2237 family)
MRLFIITGCLFLLSGNLICQTDSLLCIFPKVGVMDDQATNVYGKPLMSCCLDPVTGFYRTGQCLTGAEDYGTHIVCARMTDKFLNYSKSRGNDLITPRPEFNFPGLKAGDHWCLCISRWIEAHEADVAPPINLHATHSKALEYVTLEALELYSIAKAN